MQVFLLTLRQLGILAVLGLLGYILRKREKLTDSAMDLLSCIIVNISLPAIIFSGFDIDFQPGMIGNVAIFALLEVAVMVVSNVIGRLTGKMTGRTPDQLGGWLFAHVVSNSGLVGVVVISALYGSPAMIYVSISLVISNIYLAVGEDRIFRRTGGARSPAEGETSVPTGQKLRKLLLKPMFLAAVLGLVFFLFRIPYPVFLSEILSTVKAINAPLAMFIVGANLADDDLRVLFKSPTLYIFSLTRLVILPVLCCVILSFFPLDKYIVAALVLIAAMPAPDVIVPCSREAGADSVFAAQVTVFSTILSPVTIPLMAMLLEWFLRRMA